ncbi:hypothetical protein, partial [Rhizobium sp. B209b/85]|uniref:hypothetical protein n=1 Tax=Rhizobium sp. B209b/85 TaxID=2819992 RepID=UPI001ADAD978
QVGLQQPDPNGKHWWPPAKPITRYSAMEARGHSPLLPSTTYTTRRDTIDHCWFLGISEAMRTIRSILFMAFVAAIWVSSLTIAGLWIARLLDQ